MVDTRDLKSLGQEWLCGFESRSRHLLKFYHHYAKNYSFISFGSIVSRTDLLF